MPRLPAKRQVNKKLDRWTEIQEMRARLPIGQYLESLHLVATMGIIPMYDSRGGRVTEGDEPVPAKARVDVLTYLIDKVMPSQQEVFTTAMPDTVTPSLMAAMSNEQLHLLARDSLEEIGARSASHAVHAVHASVEASSL